MKADEALTRSDRFRRISPGNLLRGTHVLLPRILFSLAWAMALMALLLLPVNYRAGAELAHAHSLPQVLLDAAHGTVHHHGSGVADWLEPAVSDDAAVAATMAGDEKPDAGQQQDSAPATGGIHLLLVVAVLLAFSAEASPSVPVRPRKLAGLVPRVLAPPPRPLAFAA